MTLKEVNTKFNYDPPEVTNNVKVVVEIDDKYYEVTNCYKDYMVINGVEVPVVVFNESNFQKIN